MAVTDLGTISTETVSGSNAVFTLVTTPNQLQVILANGGVHTITAIYAPGNGFNGSTGTLGGGLIVTPAPLTITATTNTKTYDSTTTAAAIPTVSGLVGSDAVTGLAESYNAPYDKGNAGSGKTLSVSQSLSATLTGLDNPLALAFDVSGNLYVANTLRRQQAAR